MEDESGIAVVEVEHHLLLHFHGVFFQAEDGIRDVAVTGVQTCALPICLARTLAELVKAADLFAQLEAATAQWNTLAREWRARIADLTDVQFDAVEDRKSVV